MTDYNELLKQLYGQMTDPTSRFKTSIETLLCDLINYYCDGLNNRYNNSVNLTLSTLMFGIKSDSLTIANEFSESYNKENNNQQSLIIEKYGKIIREGEVSLKNNGCELIIPYKFDKRRIDQTNCFDPFFNKDKPISIKFRRNPNDTGLVIYLNSNQYSLRFKQRLIKGRVCNEDPFSKTSENVQDIYLPYNIDITLDYLLDRILQTYQMIYPNDNKDQFNGFLEAYRGLTSSIPRRKEKQYLTDETIYNAIVEIDKSIREKEKYLKIIDEYKARIEKQDATITKQSETIKSLREIIGKAKLYIENLVKNIKTGNGENPLIKYYGIRTSETLKNEPDKRSNAGSEPTDS